MEIILYILLGMIAVAVCVYLFHLLRLIITVLAWLLAAYLCFWGDNVLGGCLVLGIWYVFHCIMEGVVRVFGEPQDNALKENKETGESFFHRLSLLLHVEGNRLLQALIGILF